MATAQVYVEFRGDPNRVRSAIEGNGGFIPGTMNLRVVDYHQQGDGYVLTLSAPGLDGTSIVRTAQRAAADFTGRSEIGGVGITVCTVYPHPGVGAADDERITVYAPPSAPPTEDNAVLGQILAELQAIHTTIRNQFDN